MFFRNQHVHLLPAIPKATGQAVVGRRNNGAEFAGIQRQKTLKLLTSLPSIIYLPKVLEPIPSHIGEAGYTLDALPILPKGNLESPIYLACMCLDCGGKLACRGNPPRHREEQCELNKT